jgi:hypothetical protein
MTSEHTEDQATILRAMVEHAGCRLAGVHLGMPCVEDRGGSVFAIDPTGDTLRVAPLDPVWREENRARIERDHRPRLPAYGDPRQIQREERS